MNEPDRGKTDRKQYWQNMTLAVVAGQVGCLTLVIVLAAVFFGLWLDSRMGTRPAFTIFLILASIPVSLVVMLVVTRAATKRIKAQAGAKKPVSQEETDLGNDS